MNYQAIWIIAVLSTAGIIIRPFKLPEATWAVTGAVVLLIFQLILPSEAIKGIGRGTDVYFFLTGMMLLSEIAREEKLFDWLAAHATKLAKGSGSRLFLLTYLVGVAVTIFLSNDATAVVLTPAVAAAVRSAKAKKTLPFLLTCAFVANAASFVLPISNPANLVIYGNNMLPLLQWLPLYFLPSIVSIVVTYLMLHLTQRKLIRQQVETNLSIPLLTKGSKIAGLGICATAGILLIASTLDVQLGLPTLVTGALTFIIVIMGSGKKPWPVVKSISWSVIPLVAGLFVIVEALNKTGVIKSVSVLLTQTAGHSIATASWGGGILTAFACNLVNNLPAGLVAGNAVRSSQVPEIVRSSILIGIDLGPNLSITGSLATILWLVALRRENQYVSAWTFLKLGFLIMTTALLLSLASLWI